MAFILALFVRTFVFENFKIPSGSMEDNLLIGDHLVVNKFVFAGNADSILHRVFPYRSPERGDVVVFKYPGEHHDYLICGDCGTIEKLEMSCPVEALEEEVARRSGYRRIYHELEFFGTCPSCQREPA